VRVPLLLAMAVALPGCLGAHATQLSPLSSGPTHPAAAAERSVTGTNGAPAPMPGSAPSSAGPDPAPPAGPDCVESRDDGDGTLSATLRCQAGTDGIEARLDGCDGSHGAWLSLRTEGAVAAHGSAVATAASDSGNATVRTDARGPGQETGLPGSASYALRLAVTDWGGEWVAATLSCAAT